jgi:glucokinase-like ROK family protein
MPFPNSEARASIRELNLSAVLHFIYHEAPLSRAQLAGRTGLNKSTISSLVEDLLERHLIHETGINSVGKGRPATLLEINPRAGAVIAVEMGVDFVSAAVVDIMGNILWRDADEADPTASQEKTLGQTMALVEAGIAACHSLGQRILGLSFSIPGTVDLERGELIFAPNLNWRNIPFRQIFSGKTGIKVFIENDANAAAIAEHLFGVARNLRDFLFVFAGVGLGGGLFLNDRLYRGKGGYAGEIGHTPIIAEPFHNPCQCGNVGCWETYVNQYSILRRVEHRLEESPDRSLIPGLMSDQHSALSMPIITQAAGAGDRVALDSLAEAGTAMGTGFAVLVNIFNPQKVVLGGPTSIAGEYLMPSIRESVRKHGMHEIFSQAEINLSAFGPDASLVGAAAVVIDDLLMYPSHIEKEVMPHTRVDSMPAYI